MGWLIYGAGGYAKVVIDLLESIEEKIDYLFDDTFEGGLYEGHPTGHFTPDLFPLDNLIIAIGSNKDRKKIAEKLKDYHAKKLIHPQAVISQRSEIGKGTLILPNVVVHSDVTIGDFCLINACAVVDHEAIIENYVNLAPGAVISSGAVIGEGAVIGANAVIGFDVKITPWSIIPPCSVIMAD